MTFRVYSGPHGAETPSPLEKAHLLFKEFANLDEALSWAGHVKDTGRTALLIEDDLGTRLDKRAIAVELTHRSARSAREAFHP